MPNKKGKGWIPGKASGKKARNNNMVRERKSRPLLLVYNSTNLPIHFRFTINDLTFVLNSNLSKVVTTKRIIVTKTAQLELACTHVCL